MAFPTFTLQNLSGGRVSLDAKFSEDRALRLSLAPGASQVLTTGLATLEELDRDPSLRQLIDGGDLKISMAAGPTLGWAFTLTAGPATNPDTVNLVAQVPFDIQVTSIEFNVTTAVAASTVTVASQATGGTDYSSAMSGATLGLAASTADRVLIPAGSGLVANRNDESVEGLVTFQGIRLSV